MVETQGSIECRAGGRTQSSPSLSIADYLLVSQNSLLFTLCLQFSKVS